MDIPLDEVLFFDIITSTPATGAAVDADSTPTFAVYEESTDTDIGIGGNFTKRTSLTGNYRGSFTASTANGFEAGKWYSIIATAIVGAVTGKCVVKNFRIILPEQVIGAPKADMYALAGIAQSATDLRDFADEGYDPSTNKVTGVSTVDSVTNDVGITQAGADKAWDTAARTLTAGTNIALAKGVGVTGFNDIAAADVWAVATRLLTAGTNIVLVKGVGVTGFTDISAAAVNAEVDTALADYDAPTSAEMVARTLVSADYATAASLTTVAGFIDTEITTIISAIGDLGVSSIVDYHTFQTGSTHKLIRILIQDASGEPKGGLAFNTANLSMFYSREGSAFATQIALVNGNLGVWTQEGTFAEVDPGYPGMYEVGLADAMLAGGATFVDMMLFGAADMKQYTLRIRLVAYNPDSGTDLGLSSIGDILIDTGTILPNQITALNNITAASVWAVAARTLTAGTNIVLVKGTGVTGFNDLSAAQVNAEADTALLDVGVTGTVTARIDVAISTRLSTAGYTAPDNASITTISTNVTTLLARIGAFTGTTVNTVLGFFKSLLSKTATLPTDVGGTFDPATDSAEAIRDRGDVAWITGVSTGATAVEVWEYANRTLTSFSFSAEVSITSPVTDDGDINVVRGDDYLDVDGRAISLSSSGWPVLTGGTVSIHLYRLGADGIEFSKALTIVTDTGTKEVKLELTAAETDILDTSYRFNLTATLADSSIVTLVQGNFTAVERRGA